jgi:hypothetical protein
MHILNANVNLYDRIPFLPTLGTGVFKSFTLELKIQSSALRALAYLSGAFLIGLAAIALYRFCSKQLAGSSLHSGVEKTAEKAGAAFHEIADQGNLSPIGFNNHGSSCWLNSGLQVLMASKYFEEIAIRPLTVITKKMFVQHNKVHFRSETELEFQQRRNVQSALLELLDRRKERDPRGVKKALLHFHKTCVANQFLPYQSRFPAPGKSDDPNSVMEWIRAALQTSDRFYDSRDVNFFLNPSLCTPESNDIFKTGKVFEEKAKKGNIPDILRLRFDPFSPRNDYDMNQMIDLSKYAGDGQTLTYRIVGVTVYPRPGHWIAYVFQNGEWYCCDDSKVTKTSLTTLGINGTNDIILERI